jgi:N6-adenosine-specific RNA methylase IME4/ParB-like chromosome segregation protein Spo0J
LTTYTIGGITYICPYADLLPPLTPEERQTLKEDIAERGIIVPAIGLERGARAVLLLDGANRASIAFELGLPALPWKAPDIVPESEEELEDLAWDLNDHRRQLSKEARQARALKLRQRGQSYRQIAEKIGASEATIRRDVEAATASNDAVDLPETIRGKDGKERAASKPKAHPETDWFLQAVRGEKDPGGLERLRVAASSRLPVEDFHRLLEEINVRREALRSGAGLVPASRPAPAADTAPPREERRTGTFLPDPPSAPISGEAPALADPIREDAAPATASSALEVTPVVLVTATKPPFEEEGLLCPGCMEKPCACKACWICQSEDSGPLVWDRELLTCRACTPGVFEEEPAPVPLPFEEAPAGEARSPVAATVDALFARVEAQGVDPLAASAEQLGAEEPGESAKEARAARLAKVEERRQERLQVIAAEASGAEGQPERGRYGVLYVDPPWEYNQHRESRFGVPYPTLSRDELRRLDVARLCTRDAVLFLWATSPLLPEALALVAAWGFSYKSSWVWVKTTLGGEPAWGLGSWGRVAHELVLICTRGEMPTPSPAALPQSVFLSTRKEHSKKPFEVRAAIEEMYPTLPRVEVFAREAAPGWAAIGNEIDGRDIREVLGRREVAE